MSVKIVMNGWAFSETGIVLFVYFRIFAACYIINNVLSVIPNYLNSYGVSHPRNSC